MDIRKAITYITEDPYWIKKSGVIFVIQLLIGAGAQLANFTIDISSFFNNYTETPMRIMPHLTDESLIGTQLLTGLLSLFVITIIGVVLLPVYMYIGGFLTETKLNVMNGNELPLPDHTNIGLKFKYAISVFIVQFVPIFLSTLIIIIPLGILGVIVLLGLEKGIATGVITVTLFSIFTLLFIVFLFLYGFVLTPALTFRYLKTGSIFASWNVSELMKVIKVGWVRMALVSLIMIALASVASVMTFTLTLLTCGILGFLGTIVTTYASFAEAHLMGSVYRDLKEEGV